MARTRYATDRGLIARMGATMFLLGLVFTAFIIVIVLLLTRYSNVGNGGIIFIAVLLGVGGLVRLVLLVRQDRAERRPAPGSLRPQQAPQLHGIIDRLCALADMPKPRVAIAPTDMPNAFATGRSSKVAVVCVTTGPAARLDNNELEGVLAHEMSHVAHKDVAVMTIASFLGIIAGAAGQVRLLLRAVRRRRPRPRPRRQRPERAAHRAGRDAGRHRGLRDQLPADQAALAVPRTVRRPVRRAADRPAVGAGQRAGEGERRDGPDPDQGPARGRAAQRVLLRPGAVGQRGSEPVQRFLHAPDAWRSGSKQLDKISRQLSTARGSAVASGGIARHAARPDQAGAAEPRRAVRAPVGGDHPAGGHRISCRPAPVRSASAPPRAGVRRHREGRHATCSHGREQGTRSRSPPTLTASPGWSARTRPTTSTAWSPTCTR